MNTAIIAITDEEYVRFQDLVERATGIHLTEAKRLLLMSRLGRHLRRLGIASYGEYYERVISDAAEHVRLIDAICTNETRFFREPRQFDHLRLKVLPQLKRDAEAGKRARRLRIWSAGCSSGEEPYSLAMLCNDLLPETEGWDVKIVATDLSTRVLEQACQGVWPIARARDIPHDYLRRNMLRGVRGQAGVMKANAEIRKRITFGRLNLVDPPYPLDRDFNLIFCRNVLIYFDTSHRAAIVNRLFEHLLPNGFLFLGHAETLNGLVAGATVVIPNVYSK